MEVYQRKDPTTGKLLSPYWYYDVSVPNPAGGSPLRQRKSTREKRKSEAQRVAAEAQRKAEEDAKSGQRPMTLHDAMLAYIARLEAEGKVNAIHAKSILAKTFGLGQWASQDRYKLPANLTLDRMDETTINKLRQARLKEGNKVTTAAMELRILRAAYLQAAQDRRVKVNNIKWNIPNVKGKTRWLTREEWQAVYDVLDPARPIPTRGGGSMQPPPAIRDQRQQARDLLVALTMCGGRWGEVSRMTTDQVMPGGQVQIYGYKTKSHRVVGVPPEMAEVLERRAKIARELGTPYLFASNARGSERRKRGESAKGPMGGCRLLRRAMDEAGLNAPHLVERDGTATIHSLRHTFASLILQSGKADLPTVQSLLGHQSITTTLRYGHLDKGEVAKRAAGIIGAALKAPSMST